jgi:hypothetical protein
VLLLAATAGFATANLRADNSPGTPAPRSGPAVAADPQAAYLRAVDRAMQGLNTRRAEARRQLLAAREAPVQSATALGLARVYLHARRALPAPRGGVPADAALDAGLAATERAYRLMAAAGRAHDAQAFGAAGREVVLREQAVARALSRVDHVTAG